MKYLKLKQVGVVSGKDLTYKQLWLRLMFLLGKEGDNALVKEEIVKSIWRNNVIALHI